MFTQNITSLPPCPFGEDLWERLRKTEKPILVYGMGNGGDKLVARLSMLGREVADFFASDGFVRGQSFHGKRVLSFTEAREKYSDFVILVSFGSARAEVLSHVFSMAEQYELYIPDMPLAGEEYFTADFYAHHYQEIKEAHALLADDVSRNLYSLLFWYKLTGMPAYLSGAVAFEDTAALLDYAHMTSAVDVGAYRGDTLREMLSSAPRLHTVFAIEPDIKNYGRLSEYADTVSGKEIIPVHGAAWCENGELAFAASGNRNATMVATASFEHREAVVKTVKIDDLTQGRNIDYVKYDTEGAEKEALLGSVEMLRRCTPRLRVSAYHKSEDLFLLPLWLKKTFADSYDYYLRRTPCIPAWECDLIAVPRKKRGEKGVDHA